MREMRKKFRVIFAIILLLAVGGACLVLTSCSGDKQQLPTWFQIRMPDGTLIEGYGSSRGAWNSGAMTVTINGIRYYTHCSNVIACSKKP